MSSAKWRPFCPGGDELTTVSMLFCIDKSLSTDKVLLRCYFWMQYFFERERVIGFFSFQTKTFLSKSRLLTWRSVVKIGDGVVAAEVTEVQAWEDAGWGDRTLGGCPFGRPIAFLVHDKRPLVGWSEVMAGSLAERDVLHLCPGVDLTTGVGSVTGPGQDLAVRGVQFTRPGQDMLIHECPVVVVLVTDRDTNVTSVNKRRKLNDDGQKVAE